MLYLFLIVNFYSLVIHIVGENDIYSKESITCPVNFCNGTLPSTQSVVENYCLNETNENHMNGRCCIEDETDVIVGLDLRSCDIKSFNVSNINFTELVILDLRDNDINSLIPQDLTGLLNLTYLYLPYWIPCPGGKEAWNETETYMNDTYCYLQQNPCVYLNISCTDNGECIHKGPGYAKCVCKPGYFGYKCLNEGEFPATPFSISIVVSTVVLSVVLWFAHGRDAYKRR